MSMFSWKTALGSAEEFKRVVTSGAGWVRYASFFNTHATTTIYVWLFDGADATGTPIWGPVVLGPGRGDKSTFDGPLAGAFDSDAELTFTNGLYIAASTTNATFTAVGANCLRMYIKGVN